MKKPTETEKRTLAVVVTTAHRGVFFGYVDPAKVQAEIVDLRDARLCTYWSPAMRGFMGLASIGPDALCKVGPRAAISLRAITSVVEVQPAAVAAWEAAPWSR